MGNGFFGSRKEHKEKVEAATKVILEEENKQQADLELSKLSAFIRRPENQEKLTAEANGEINFSVSGAYSHFDAKKDKHQHMLHRSINQFNEKKAILTNIDSKIVLSFLGGVLALSLGSIFPPLATFLGIPLLMYSAYQYGKREAAHENYNAKLNQLCDVYVWCFNDKEAKVMNGGDKLQQKTINRREVYSALDQTVATMMCTLGPALSEEDVVALTRNDIEEQFKDDREEAQAEAGVSKLDTTMEYLMYGRGQGSVRQVLVGIGQMIAELFGSLCQSCAPKNPEMAAASRR